MGERMKRVGRSVLFIAAFGAVCLATLVSAPSASAALCARWDPPSRGSVGTPSTLSFRTYLPISTVGDDYTLEPRAFLDYPFRVRSASPDGTVSTINMSPDAGNGQVWVGTLTPDQQGPWTLSITNLQGSDGSCYQDAVLDVEQGVRSQAPPYVAIGLVVAICAGLASLAWIRRHRREGRSARRRGPADGS